MDPNRVEPQKPGTAEAFEAARGPLGPRSAESARDSGALIASLDADRASKRLYLQRLQECVDPN